MIMDKKEKNFATYKEFAKMLREVANIYSGQINAFHHALSIC